MKKLLFLFAVLLGTVGAWAQVTQPTTGVYTIEGGTSDQGHRGFLAACEGISNYPALADIGWSDHVGKSNPAITNGKDWYVHKIETENRYVIYNLGLKKFLVRAENNINFSDAPYKWQIIVNSSNSNYNSIYDKIKNYVSFACGTKANGSGTRNVNFYHENTDGGSMHTFTPVEDGTTTYSTDIEHVVAMVNAMQTLAISDVPSNGEWAQNTTWFQIKNGNGKVLRADALTTEGYLALNNTNTTLSDVGLWCVVGNSDDGYMFYNKAKGTAVVIGMTGSEGQASAVFVAPGASGYTTTFDIVPSTDHTNLCVKAYGTANKYWNERAPRLAYWDNNLAQNNNDSGSELTFAEVDLSTIDGLATAEQIAEAKSIMKVAPGYPKTTSAQYRILDVLTNSTGVVKTELDAAVSAYKTCSDVLLPEDGKAYTIANYSLLADGGTITRYLYYTAGSPLSVKEGEEFASVYVCRQLSNGVYAFVTSDGKVLTWMGNTSGLESDAGYIENGNCYGYSSEYGKVYLNSSEWNRITVHKHLTAENNLGHLCIKGYRSSTHTGASFVVDAPTGAWNRNTVDGGYYGTDYSTAWIFTEVTHTKTAAQNERLAEIDATVEAIAHVDANASKLGDGIGYAHYMLGETKSIDAAAVKTAINNATTAEEVNAIKNSFKYEVPQTGTLYALYDATHSVYLDLHHLGVETNDKSYTQLATLNNEKQLLYITANSADGTWKIHTHPEGGNYLHQASGTRSWNSWVSDAGANFNWQVEVVVEEGVKTYKLANISGSNNGYLGVTDHVASKELYVNNTGNTAANALKLSLVEANVTPEEELAYIKMATKAALTQYTAKLKNQSGYYYCTINGTKVYDATTVNSKIDEAQSIEKIAEIADAVRNQHLILPEPGKAYKMAFKSTSSKLFYIKADDAAIDKSEVESDASIFFCLQSASDGYPFIFVSEDGKVLAYHETPASTLLDDYDSSGDRCNFKIEGMLEKTENIKARTEAIRLGTVCITAGKRESGNNTDGCFVFNSSAKNYDKAPSAFFNDNFTSAIIMTEVENYEMPEVQKAKVDAILGKDAVKTQVEAIKNELKNHPGYYYCTIHGKKYYDADAILALIDATQSLKTLNEISTAVTNKTLITPEVGKYYRIKGKTSGNYIDASGQTNAQMNMKADPNILGSIFLFEEGSRLKNMSTGTYVYNTHSIGATQGNANTWTFISSGTGYFKVKSNYSSPWLHDSGNKANRCSSDGADHEFIIEEVPSYALTIDAPAPVGATATWNGETKALPATWTICEGMTITNPELTLNYDNVNYTFGGLFEGEEPVELPASIEELPADRSFTAKFTPAFFSASTDAGARVPVQIYNMRDKGYTICLNNAATYTGNAVNSGTTEYSLNEIWYLVGNAESFKMYSHTAGMDLALTLAGTGGGSAATMTANGTELSLTISGNAYCITPKANKGQSFNMHGGKGHDIKLYSSGDGGSTWGINVMDITHSLTYSVSVSGTPWDDRYGVGELTFNVNGISSSTHITEPVAAQTCYLPKNATFTLSSIPYRGYTFSVPGGAESYEGTLAEGNLTIDLAYTANEEKILYHTPDANGKPYRIPAIAAAPNGHIFAIADNRPCGKDIGYGEVDIKCRISKDNGATWGDEFFIANGLGELPFLSEEDRNKTGKELDDAKATVNNMHIGFGDAAVVADRESNKLLVMMVAGRTVCHNGRWEKSKIGDEDADDVNRVARVYATYNEETEQWDWTQPEEVTDDMYSIFLNGETATVTSMFIGSGKICQSRVVKKGQYYRLYCALWTRDGGNRVIYSDDFGDTWNVLGTIAYRPASGGDEPKCEELPDGTVVLSSRKGGGRYFNLFTFSDDTYTTGSWGTVASSNDIAGGLSFGGNSTNGEIYKVKAIRKSDGKICDVMLQSVPTGGGRDNVAIFYKEMEYNADGTNKYAPEDFAKGWTKGIHVSTKNSCYSTMILQADGRLGFFFEEEPGEYCMVYIPYTIEDVTDKKYSLYTVTSTIGEHKVGTFYATEAMQIPDGIKAYVATESPVVTNGVGVITMEELEGIIPAKTGAVLRGAANNYEFIPSISYGTPVANNMMVGYEAADNKAESKGAVTLDDDYSTYILNVDKNGENPGFYVKNSAFNVANNKAYLKISKSLVQNARAIYFDFDDNTTEIESVFDADNTGVIYDLQGRQLKQVTSNGIYIVNGKKVLK